MKMLNRVLIAVALLTFTALSPVFAEGDFSFENEISTDTYILGDRVNDNRRFGGIKERIQGVYTSKKVDLNANISLDVRGETGDVGEGKKSRAQFDWLSVNDSYFKFRPMEKIQIAVATEKATEKASGSFFPVLNDYVVGLGNYTGNVGVLFKPIEGLSVGAGINFGYLFDGLSDSNDIIHLNFGGEYELKDIGLISVTFNNVINNFGIGAFAKFTAVKNMDIYAGLSFQLHKMNMVYAMLFTNCYNEYSDYINGKLLLNAGLEYKGVEKLTLAADIATNCFIEADWTHDLYAGVKAGYDINKSFSVDGKIYMFLDLVDSSTNGNYDDRYKPSIFLYPEVAYKTGSHTFTAGIKMEFYDGVMGMAFPLSWKYSF
ncbi:MAG: hypothetical protein J5857_10390 [Treponema sp.]|nr:hypothetical protein [Treponema sp.]